MEILSRTWALLGRLPWVRVAGLLLILTIAGRSGAVHAQTFSENAVKAAYLFRFASYVNWPDEAKSTTPFVISVFGAPAVAQELLRLHTTQRIDGRPIEVRELRGLHDIGRPQILYVGAGHAGELRLLEPELIGSATLLVTDDEDGLNWGSVLNFLTLDHRVRFEVSLTAAERAHLRISADLLAVAVRVRGAPRQTRDSCVPGALDEDAGCNISVAGTTERLGRRPATRPREAPG